jgi:signal transduction histidine kinase
MIDEEGEILSYNNIPETKLGRRAAQMQASGTRIEVPLGDGELCYICYDDSDTLVQLAYYPYIQLSVVVVFFIICFVAILNSKRAEQNRVWVGLSKETAHQLGTPISSLMAWVEILKGKYPGDELLPEMSRDVERLQMVAERFSKIGSKSEPVTADVNGVIEKAVGYMKRRSPAKVQYELILSNAPLLAPLNIPLLEWVIENLCKNAIDAMSGNGCITVEVSDTADKVVVDVTDTGKGIAKSQWDDVFTPGFTTKPRGWGLGLSLAKRIVEEFHKGRIYIKKSLAGKGTTFRIELKK